MFQRACHEAGLHDLRHAFGEHCAQAGMPIVRIQKLLGHSTDSTVEARTGGRGLHKP